MPEPLSCCFTGYRPHKFPFAMNRQNPEYLKMENKLIDAVFSLPDEGCCTFYTGVAMGFDLIAAETVLLLRESSRKAAVRLICVVPFIGQAQSFDPEWKERYESVLRQADLVLTLSDHYFKGCYQKRNEYMVNRSNYIITWYDGQSGGTRNTLRYAEQQSCRIVNLNGCGVHDYTAADDFDLICEDE